MPHTNAKDVNFYGFLRNIHISSENENVEIKNNIFVGFLSVQS